MNSYLTSLTITLISSLSLIPLNQLTLAENQPNNQEQTSSSSVIFKPKGEPRRTTGGATRNERLCPQDKDRNNRENANLSLIALVPSQQIELTVTSHPTVWIQLSPTSAKRLIFNVQEQDNNQTVFQSIIPINNQLILIPLSIPSDSPELEVGKVYEWSVTLICGDIPHPNDPTISATIERISLPSIPALSDLEIAAWYAEQGIWYDALNNLALIHENNNSAEIEFIWQEFLKSGGIDL
ncbi:MAG: DUF928 domain-containing protein [Microcystaceae cyanobacterium]